MNASKECAIVGGGLAGLVGYATLRFGGLTPAEIHVFGTDADPAGQWRTRAAAIRQRRMRSESEGHVAARSFPGLAVRAAVREKSPAPLLLSVLDRYRPTVKEFLDHVAEVRGRSGWDESFRCRRIERIRAVDDGFELDGALVETDVPSSLQDSLMMRLDGLGRSRALASLAATIGRTFDVELLREVAETDDVEDELEQMVSAGVLVHAPMGTDSRYYTFGHALVREAAYQSITRRTRRGRRWTHPRCARGTRFRRCCGRSRRPGQIPASTCRGSARRCPDRCRTRR